MQSLELVTATIPKIRAGEVTNTIRNGKRDYTPGPLCFSTTDRRDRQSVNVKSVEVIPFRELSADHIRANGATSAECLMSQMKTFYPKITEDSLVTVISWEEMIPEY